MAGKVHRTAADSDGGADDDAAPGEVHIVPGLMDEIKLARKIEKMRRDRDKTREAIDQEHLRLERSGILASNATLKILEQKLATTDADLEKEIQRMIELKGGAE